MFFFCFSVAANTPAWKSLLHIQVMSCCAFWKTQDGEAGIWGLATQAWKRMNFSLHNSDTEPSFHPPSFPTTRESISPCRRLSTPTRGMFRRNFLFSQITVKKNSQWGKKMCKHRQSAITSRSWKQRVRYGMVCQTNSRLQAQISNIIIPSKEECVRNFQPYYPSLGGFSVSVPLQRFRSLLY